MEKRVRYLQIQVDEQTYRRFQIYALQKNMRYQEILEAYIVSLIAGVVLPEEEVLDVRD